MKRRFHYFLRFNDQDVNSPGEGDTTSTGSFYLFPTSPIPADHMDHGRPSPSGGVSVDNIVSQDQTQKIASDVNENVEVTDGAQTNGNVVNGRGRVKSQSIHSMDVLSGVESDAADTLSRPQKLFDSGTICKSTMGGVERRKKWTGNPDYFATKELLMTERAYQKDLEVITMWWSQLVSEGTSLGWLSSGHAEALGRPCLAIEGVALASASLLPRVDACFTAMDTAIDSQNVEEISISQILRDHLRENLSIYEEYILRGGYLVGRVERARRGDGSAERACRSLESSRAPLPLATHLLRPLHRILYYGETLQRLAANEEDMWKEEDKTVLSHLVELAGTQLSHAENHAHLCQLQRDITGYDNLLVAGREFIRMGCLFKNSNKGLLQRMFFLFSDTLLYASKTSGTSEQLFRVHSSIPLHSVQLQPADYANAFILQYEGSVLTLSTNSVEERDGWWSDLAEGAAAAHDTSGDTQHQNLGNQNAVNILADDVTHNGSQGTGMGVSLAHVCWHRCTSLTRAQLHLASRTQLSGYLLRKFKNSHGWQKLWVVYAVFALYFYKGWQDNLPLASLPLLGYNVTTPNERDGINKDFVFKLVFKNHVYFFRAESEYTYNRWMNVIRTAMTPQ